jgi:signal transduction histidine kinase
MSSPLLEKDRLHTRDFQNFLDTCIASGEGHLALLIDHLQILPQDLIHGMLKALRALYMERNPTHKRQLSVVIVGNLSLAELSQGPNSPFNIAKRLFLPPLSPEQSIALVQATMKENRQSLSSQAAVDIVKWAGGDCFLLPYLCHLAQETVAGYRRPLVTQTVVRQAVDRLWQLDEAQWPILGAIRLIEGDVDSLLDVLDIMQHGKLAHNLVRQRFSRTGINRLDLCGALALKEECYEFKNELYRQAFRERLTPSHVARVLRMAGRWREAIDHLSPVLGQVPSTQERADLLEAIVQSIYAADSLEDAYAELMDGIRRGFDFSDIAIYRVDAAQSELCLVQSRGDGNRAQERIALTEESQVEVRTYHSANYALPKDAQNSQRLIAALIPEKRPIGIVSIQGYHIPDEVWEIPQNLAELLRFLRYAAGAIENVMIRSAFQEIGRAVLDVSTMDSSLRRVLSTVSNALGCTSATLYLLEGMQEQHLKQVTYVGDVDYPAELTIAWENAHPAMRALKKNTLVTIRGTQETPPRLFLPLATANRSLGVLELGFHLIHQPVLTPEYRSILNTFGDQVSIAVHNMQLLRSTDEALQARQKELEETRQKLELLQEQELTDVARALLHRLNNISGDVPFHLKRVRHGLLQPSVGIFESVDHVEKRFHSLFELRRPMENLVRLEKIEYNRIDLVEVLRTTTDRVARPPGVNFQIYLSRQPIWVSGNHELLVDAFQSLLDNGCEAMPRGGSMSISCKLVKDTALVTIQDTGTGIPEEVQERMYEPGYTTKQTREGERGQGLFTCRAILRKHRCQIHHQSQLGVGTTFTIEVPLLGD